MQQPRAPSQIQLAARAKGDAASRAPTRMATTERRLLTAGRRPWQWECRFGDDLGWSFGVDVGVDVGVELPAAPTPRRARLRLAVPDRAHPRVELARVEVARRSAPRWPRSACLCGPRRPPACAAGMKVDGGGAPAVDGERALGGQQRRRVHRLLLLLVSAQGSRAVEPGACDFDWDRFGGEAGE
jgi:hypothetical protein